MASIPADHEYELLEYDDEDPEGFDKSAKAKRRVPLLWRLERLVKTYPKTFFISLLILVLLTYSLSTWPFWRVTRTLDCDNIQDGYQCEPDISHHWGQYSPYFSVPSDISNDTPDRCEVTFVQILSRHGARDPTEPKSRAYSDLMDTLQAVVDSFSGKYAFLNDYRYTLGEEQLTKFGRQHMYNSGAKFYDRYKTLASAYTPFVRASGQTRVMDSAQLFTQGYHEACLNETHDGDNKCNGWPYPYVEIPEGPESHNPLDSGLCDAFQREHHAGTSKQGQKQYRDTFTEPITARLNKDLPGADLDKHDSVMLMDLCPFETAADSSGKLSPFCRLFTKEEWKQYDYYQTLGKYYGHASFATLGPTQGVGFINELIARLTGNPVEDHTSVDHHLDGDSKTFPLGKDWAIYADFSHDNTMVAIMSAMGLFNETTKLSNETLQNGIETKGFQISWLVPFAGRMYVEKLACKDTKASDETEEYVRVIINDRVQPMKSCNADSLGRCTLADFLDSLSFAKQGGRWDEC